MAVIKCKNTAPYVQRSQCGKFTWHVYNKETGQIVASTYDELMAMAILLGIKCNPKTYTCEYDITENWQEPEPMV
jgi:hypothetical protein